MRQIQILLVFAGAAFLANSAMGQSLYDVIPLGLTDAEHVRSDGRVLSTSMFHNQSGQVAGRSERYTGMLYNGLSAWAYDGDEIHRIGLIDAQHTRSDGYRISEPTGINESGDVLGRSTQYTGSSSTRSAWIYTNGQTHQLGFLDARHTATNGKRDSFGYQLNEAGQAIGTSRQYSGNSNGGTSAWISTGTQLQQIGRLTPNGFNAQGFSGSEPEQLNEAGQVAGYAALYSESKVYLGNTAWFYENGVTIDIGLEDAIHVGLGGKIESRSSGINARGDVIGDSTRYNGGYSTVGVTAWVHPHGESTRAIGLFDGDHVRSDGWIFNSAARVNELGQVGGHGSNFAGTSEGTSAWFYDGQTTVEVGILDAEHTRADGTRFSQVNIMNNTGTVAGLTRQRATRNGVNGFSAYTYSNGETRRIGLLNGVHTMSNGYSSNVVRNINDAGQITGVATRIGSSSTIGATAWFYDPETDITYPLEFDVNASGVATSSVSFLSDTGVCLGEFMRHSSSGAPLGYHAFYWSVDDGFHDLGSLDGTGFVGWQNIYNAIVINGIGQALATGDLQSLNGFQSDFGLPSNLTGTLPVLLNPVGIPEPTTLGVLGAIGAIALRRRSN